MPGHGTDWIWECRTNSNLCEWRRWFRTFCDIVSKINKSSSWMRKNGQSIGIKTVYPWWRCTFMTISPSSSEWFRRKFESKNNCNWLGGNDDENSEAPARKCYIHTIYNPWFSSPKRLFRHCLQYRGIFSQVNDIFCTRGPLIVDNDNPICSISFIVSCTLWITNESKHNCSSITAHIPELLYAMKVHLYGAEQLTNIYSASFKMTLMVSHISFMMSIASRCIMILPLYFMIRLFRLDYIQFSPHKDKIHKYRRLHQKSSRTLLTLKHVAYFELLNPILPVLWYVVVRMNHYWRFFQFGAFHHFYWKITSWIDGVWMWMFPWRCHFRSDQNTPATQESGGRHSTGSLLVEWSCSVMLQYIFTPFAIVTKNTSIPPQCSNWCCTGGLQSQHVLSIGTDKSSYWQTWNWGALWEWSRLLGLKFETDLLNL